MRHFLSFRQEPSNQKRSVEKETGLQDTKDDLQRSAHGRDFSRAESVMVEERMDINTIRDLHSLVDSIKSNDTFCSSVFLYLPVSRCNDRLNLLRV